MEGQECVRQMLQGLGESAVHVELEADGNDSLDLQAVMQKAWPEHQADRVALEMEHSALVEVVSLILDVLLARLGCLHELGWQGRSAITHAQEVVMGSEALLPQDYLVGDEDCSVVGER